MLIFITPIGLEKRSISVNEDLNTEGSKKIMRGLFWISRTLQATYSFLPSSSNYLEDMEHRLKPTTMENKRFIIETKLLPYFGKQKICDIDTIKVRKWQNELISYRDDDGKPFSQTYLKTVK